MIEIDNVPVPKIRGSKELTCPVCEIKFRRPLAHIRNATQCCSKRCSEQIKPRRTKQILNKVACKECSKIFTPTVKNKDQEFCCIKCMASYRGKQMAGENHPNWKGGTSKRDYKTRKATTDKKNQIGKCEKCNASEIKLHAHHILHYSKNPELRADPNNIEILCTNCHILEHPEYKGMLSYPNQRFGSNIVCIICGNERYVKPNLLKTAKYCSKKCQLQDLHNLTRDRYDKGMCFGKKLND